MILISAIFIFILTALISFSVSLQAGPVTLSVIRFSMHKQQKNAIAVALGGTFMELIYAAMAVLLAEFLYKFVIDWEFMVILGPLVMLGFGLYLILMANKKFIRGIRVPMEFKSPFLKGIRLALSNPQIFLFYCGLLLAYYQFKFTPEFLLMRYLSFTLGAATGFFLLLMMVQYFVRRQGRINNHYFRGSKIMYFSGFLMIAAALYQLVIQLLG